MLYRSAVMCLLVVFAAGASGDTIFFSIDAASPSVPGVSNNDVLAPGPVGGPPAVATPSGALGLPPGLPDELDALTIGSPVDPLAIFFSVDRAATGLAVGGDVFSEAAVGHAAGDVFVSFGGGSNTLVFNQDILGLQPATPPGTPTSPPIDNLDALDLVGPVGAFSLLAGNSFGLSGADILFNPDGEGPPGVLVSATALGLSPADDVDALHLDTLTGDCLFSLVPGSPSLATLAAGPGDVLVAPGCGGGGAPSVLFAANTLGLASGDNLDGLAFIPEPGRFFGLVAGLTALAGLRRRRFRVAMTCFPLAVVLASVSALPAAGAERPVSAAMLRIEQALTSAGPQPSVNFRSDDAAVAAPFANPGNGATFFVGTSSATGQCRLEISFLPSRWSPINGNGAQYGYTYLESDAQGLLTATYAQGRIQVLARGALARGATASCDHSLPQQAPVSVELRVEAQRNCAALGGDVQTNLPNFFVASGAPAPAGCSDADVTVANLNVLHGHACDPPTPGDGDQCRVVERMELLLDHVVAAGCPDVVTMQEHIVKMFVTSGTSNPLPLPVPVPVTKGPLESTVQLIRDRLPGLAATDKCGFLYNVVFDPENQTQNPSPARGGDEEMMLTRYPALEAAVTALYTPVSPFFERHILYARIDHPLGPLDVYTTHFSSGSDNGGDLCGVQLELIPGVPSPPCPPECDPSKSVRVCQAVQLAQRVASTHDVPQPAIVTGDLNSPANAPANDAMLAQLTTGEGWIDTYLAAGNPECNPATGIGCTSGRNDFSLVDLENPLSQESERIDYALLVPPGPGSSCVARIEAAGDPDGDLTATRIFTDLPDLPCGPGKVCWPSDHEGAELDLECAP